MGKWLARVVVMFLGAVMAMSLINVPAAYSGNGEPEQPELPTLEECLDALSAAEPESPAEPESDGTAQVAGPLEGLTDECLELLGNLRGILQPQPQPPTPAPQPAPPPSTSFADTSSLPADAVVAQPRFTG